MTEDEINSINVGDLIVFYYNPRHTIVVRIITEVTYDPGRNKSDDFISWKHLYPCIPEFNGRIQAFVRRKYINVGHTLYKAKT